MKILITTILFIAAFAAQNAKAQTTYVGCMGIQSDEYNILLVLENGQLAQYATLESDLQLLLPISANGAVIQPNTVIQLNYLSEYDTNFSYQLKVTTRMDQNIQIQPWTSGNDSDNYFGSPSAEITMCHKLKSKPENAVLDTKNYDGSLGVSGL